MSVDVVEAMRASAEGTVEFGRSVEVAELPDLVLHDGCRLALADGVQLRRGVELWITGNSVVEIGERVKLDRGVRIVATNGSTVRIGADTAIGLGSVLNGGAPIEIGEKCLLSGYVYLQTSMHRFAAGTPIRDQGYDHAPVVLGDDVWLGAHATVLPGCTLAPGTVVGSNAVVTASTGPDEVWAGVPARLLRRRA